MKRTPRRPLTEAEKIERRRSATARKGLEQLHAKRGVEFSKTEYKKQLDAARGKVALYNELHGTTYNAAELLYRQFRYGDKLSKRQKEILNMAPVAHGHRAGESQQRSRATSKKYVSQITELAVLDFGEKLGKMAQRSRKNAELGITTETPPFYEIYDDVLAGKRPLAEGYAYAHKYKIEKRGNAEKGEEPADYAY